jgi:hypothetical protein
MLFSRRSLTVFTLLLVLALMPGCGKKLALIPPQELVPVAINDLRYSLDESGVSLKWTYPDEMESGDELQAIESFQLLWSEIPEEDFCEGCPVRFENQVLIDGGPLTASGESITAAYKEVDMRNGYRYLYKVRSRAGWWYPSSDSNIISFTWRSPPKVPEGLQVVPGDRKLILSWEPVKENIAGRPLEQVPMYQVYRKSGNDQFAALGEPVQELNFIDTGLNNSMLYGYMVRALVTYGDTRQAGGVSREISGIPRDLTPPAQPENLVAVETPAGVKLVWQAVVSDDIGGYRIYRREENSAEAELIAEVGSDRNQYVDPYIIDDSKWFYSVTSFDREQPPNESLRVGESSVGHR